MKENQDEEQGYGLAGRVLALELDALDRVEATVEAVARLDHLAEAAEAEHLDLLEVIDVAAPAAALLPRSSPSRSGTLSSAHAHNLFN